MKGTFYRYKAPSLSKIRDLGIDKATPIHQFSKSKPLFIKKFKILISDIYIIELTLAILAGAYLQTQSSVFGPYLQIENQFSAVQAIAIFAFPIGFFVSVSYYALSYLFNGGSSVFNHWHKTKIVPLNYLVDGNERNFKITDKQALERSLANALNFIFLYIPNLISIVDVHHRSFPDIYSNTITIEENHFHELFISKGSPEYQLLIDIDALETSQDQLELEFERPIAA